MAEQHQHALVEISEQYRSALSDYLDHQQEGGLEHAYNLGRLGVSMGLGVLDMASLHRQALDALVRRAESIEHGIRLTDRASEFFAECLAPFEMVHLGFRDSFAELRRLNQAVTERAAELAAANELIASLSRSRTAFLAEASRRLATSLDHPSTLQTIARLPVPHLADWCAVDLLEEGVLRRAAVAHADPAKEPLIAGQLARHPLSISGDDPIARVIRTGSPELVTNASIPSRPAPDEAREQLRAMGIHSLIVVPLVAHDQPLGALTVAAASRERAYDEDDLLLLVEFGRRAALALENARLYREAQQAIRLRDDFLSIASHELRTPLTPLSLRLQAAARRLRNGQPVDLTVLETAIRQVGRLGELVNDLLDATRVEAGKLELRPQPLDLATLVAEVVHNFRSSAPDRLVTLHSPPSVPVLGDRARLEQVVNNLVDNAMKYSPGQREVQVALERLEGEVLLRVHDQGIGIAADQQKELFKRFFRASNARKETSGLGLGLYICRDIVERHGGRIWVESIEGAGSTFFVALPVQEAPGEGAG